MADPERKLTEEQEDAGAAIEDTSHLEEEYEYSSGIVERPGTVPLWLGLVYVGIIVWAIYYIIVYWNGDINLLNE